MFYDSILSGYEKGVRIYNLSTQTNPILVGYYDDVGYSFGLDVKDDLLALCSNGMKFMNVSDPTSPTLIKYFSIDSTLLDATIHGDFCYTASYAGGMHVFNISDPTSPSLIGHLPTVGLAKHVEIVGDYALISAWSAGLMIADISDPSEPSSVVNISLSNYPYKCVVDGSIAHVLLCNRLVGLNISNLPHNTSKIGRGIFFS